MTVHMTKERPSVLMEDVSWDYYSHTLQELGPSRGTRIIYDQGRMEIVTTSNMHERIKKVIARLLEMYAYQTKIDIVGDGTLTLRRESLRRGLEPDECYYVQTPAPAITEGEFDLSINPPPDLAIEVEVSQTVISKIPIYASLGISEVWKYAAGKITPLHLTPTGAYQPSSKSIAFPNLDMGRFSEFVAQALSEGNQKALDALCAWVSQSSKRS
jgi:Uma2 family endonuclease